MKWMIFIFIFLAGCTVVSIPVTRPSKKITGSDFYAMSAGYNWKQRDSLAVEYILQGNFPSFLKKFVPVEMELYDSSASIKNNITIYVSPDYLSVGNDQDWARVPLTPMAAKIIADSFHCMLPTVAMVDAIYNAAVVKLSPVPMFAFRDSTPTMYHHHLIIEGQRKGAKGLIAGIKKDVVQFNAQPDKSNRVAIYGWHRPDGKPIQPYYTGHVNWYVDYSHGIRLVYKKVKWKGKWVNYDSVFGK
jgi:hypothetical protein